MFYSFILHHLIYSAPQRLFPLTSISLFAWTVMLMAKPSHTQPCSATRNFTVGLLVPRYGLKPQWVEVERAMEVLFRELNDRCEVDGYHLTYLLGEAHCSVGKELLLMNDLYQSGARAIIGPACDLSCLEVGHLAAEWRLPMISYGCESTLLANRAQYPTFARTTGTYTELSRFLEAVLKHFEWHYGVVIVTTISSVNDWLEMVDEIMRNMGNRTHGKAFSTLSQWTVKLEDEDAFVEEFGYKLSEYFVFLLCMYPENTWRFLSLVKSGKYFRSNLVFISFNFLNLDRQLNRSTHSNRDFTGLLDITMNVQPESASFKQFLKKVNNQKTQIGKSCLPYEYGVYAALMADAVYVLAKGMKRSLQASNSGSLNTSDIMSHIYNLTFKGFTGQVQINTDGTRYSHYMLHNLVGECYYPVATMTYTGQATVTYKSLSDSLIWPGNSIHTPTCPRHICREAEKWKLLLGLSVGAVLVVVCCILIPVQRILEGCMCRRKMRRQRRMDWIIKPEALYSVVAFTGKMSSHNTTSGRYSRRITRWPIRAESTTFEASRDSMQTFKMGQIFAKVTVLDQQLVAIKPVNKQTIIVTASIILEINRIRSLKHPNVNQLIGACIKAGQVCLVWNYCAKGSLRDVLNNTTIKLDSMFKISFITDIAKGMAYLHNSPVCVHGRLKSSNVLVDDNWNCKVSDFNMPCFRQGESSDLTEYQAFYNLIWTAPELLRTLALPIPSTKKGDVYAFAIIAHEILTRLQPFDWPTFDNPEEVVRKVLVQQKPPFRPHIPESSSKDNINEINDEGVLDLMIMCWDEYPLLRPCFATIVHNLRKLRQAYGTTSNLVDQMLAVTKKYADNLEELVEERTQQLKEEQKKTEDLLCRMLPKSVAHSLKLGKPVTPESYLSVTIFFSDIVGFTALAAESTPMQVVTMLNDLYTAFDNIVDKYDAYKIETIGDAYMVVSGLPVRNGDRHAAEIASVALEILIQVLGFEIRHRPDKHLLLRIGLHTGPVLAGVVGLKMPRYCLFGDTVNYASSMESTGKPLHIHISPECKSYLDKLGGFHTQERSEAVEVKGMGTVETYFLVAKDELICCVPKLASSVRELVGIQLTVKEDEHENEEITQSVSDVVTEIVHKIDDMRRKHKTHKMTGKHETDKMTGKHETDKMTGKHETDKMTGKHETDETTGKHETDETTGKHETDETTGKHETDETTGKHETDEMEGKNTKKTKEITERKTKLETKESAEKRRLQKNNPQLETKESVEKETQQKPGKITERKNKCETGKSTTRKHSKATVSKTNPPP